MFERVGMSSGNIRTDNLVLNDKGHLKLINLLTWPESVNRNYRSRFYCNYKLIKHHNN